uniref:Uncharacterized protein n=1 Tax=Glossina brevipalpis TaxID=37001 RepID=A0A1A9WCE2_9MUSC
MYIKCFGIVASCQHIRLYKHRYFVLQYQNVCLCIYRSRAQVKTREAIAKDHYGHYAGQRSSQLTVSLRTIGKDVNPRDPRGEPANTTTKSTITTTTIDDNVKFLPHTIIMKHRKKDFRIAHTMQCNAITI